MTQDLDEIVRGLLVKLKQQQAELDNLKGQIQSSWKTHCSFTTTPNNAATKKNIQVCSDEEIFQFVQHMMLLRHSHLDAEKFLNASFPWEYLGHTYTDWEHDLKKRMDMIRVTKREKELKELEQRINSVVSAEERRRIEVESLLSIIK